MTSYPVDRIEESAHVLLHEIRKLEELGLTFAASLVRIAHLDLQMRLHNVTEEEVDVLSFAVHAVEKERRTRNEQQRTAEGGSAGPVAQEGGV